MDSSFTATPDNHAWSDDLITESRKTTPIPPNLLVPLQQTGSEEMFVDDDAEPDDQRKQPSPTIKIIDAKLMPSWIELNLSEINDHLIPPRTKKDKTLVEEQERWLVSTRYRSKDNKANETYTNAQPGVIWNRIMSTLKENKIN